MYYSLKRDPHYLSACCFLHCAHMPQKRSSSRVYRSLCKTNHHLSLVMRGNEFLGKGIHFPRQWMEGTTTQGKLCNMPTFFLLFLLLPFPSTHHYPTTTVAIIMNPEKHNFQLFCILFRLFLLGTRQRIDTWRRETHSFPQDSGKFYVLHAFTSLNAAAAAGSLYVSKLAI